MADETKTHRLPLSPTRGVGFRVRIVGDEPHVVVVGNPSERLYVGSSNTCALVLRDVMVSRKHLAIQSVGTQLRVTERTGKGRAPSADARASLEAVRELSVA